MASESRPCGPVKNESLYRNKKIMAPMVRIGTLPMRLLALDYGADLVYCEEIIDRKILMCQKQENELLGTTDFILSDGTVVFRTCPREKDQLVFQVGTADAKRALAAAKKIQDYVAAVDVNMGCPKEFSIKGGMGAALITQPDKVKDILTTLVQGLSIPVTCKIRVLPSLEDTISLAKVIEATGVSALAVHGRTKTERSRDPCRDPYIRAVAEAVHIPVIANGGSKNMTSAADIECFRQRTGTSSVMVARAAQWNCSVFRPEGPLPWLQVLQEYLRYAFLYDNNTINSKYCVLQILHDKMTERSEADLCLAARSLEDFASIWKMKSEYDQIMQDREERRRTLSQQSLDPNLGAKRRKTEDGLILFELPVRFNKRLYSSTMTPKQILNNLCKRRRMGIPYYDTTERTEDRCFHSTVKVEGKVYTNSFWEKSKQPSEQGAAICCLVVLGEHDGRLSEPIHETDELRRKWKETLCNQWPDMGDNAVSKEDGDAIRHSSSVNNDHDQGAAPVTLGGSNSVNNNVTIEEDTTATDSTGEADSINDQANSKADTAVNSEKENPISKGTLADGSTSSGDIKAIISDQAVKKRDNTAANTNGDRSTAHRKL